MIPAISITADAYKPDLAPVGGSLVASALIALIPLLTVFVTLGWLRWKAHWAGLTAVAVAILVAVLFYRMPAGLAVLSATEGAVFGLFLLRTNDGVTMRPWACPVGREGGLRVV